MHTGISVTNAPRRSLQIDADFAFHLGMEPWPRYYAKQDALLAGNLPAAEKEKLRRWIAGQPVEDCV